MKRFFLLWLTVLLLVGCTNEAPPSTEPSTDPASVMYWVEANGLDWDAAGVLKEIPLTIPDSLHYTATMEFDGDLLLWSTDSHLADQTFVELCVLELDNGSIIAQRDVAVSEYVVPRPLGEHLYLCDTQSGTILKLNKHLETVEEGTFPATDGIMYVGGNGSLYVHDAESHLYTYDPATGEQVPVLDGNPAVDWVSEDEDCLIIKYYDPNNGAPSFGVLDLSTGERFYATTDDVDGVTRMGNTWLYEKYLEQYVYYLHTDGAEPLRFTKEGSNFSLLAEGYLLENSMDGGSMGLYHLDGTLISTCTVFANGNGYGSSDPIWNEALGGYFLMVHSYDETARLLFWDLSKGTEGENLPLEPLPEPDAVQAGLEAKADTLEEKYGLTILVGDQCDTQFDEFSATQIADWDQVSMALDTLDEALSVYPENFIRQLRWDSIHGIQIQLISDLQADGSGRSGGGYNAFTQPQWGHYLMVMDIESSSQETYYHEMSHIIDSYLDWDAQQRADALYSENGWNQLNPSWFDGYTYDYSQEQPLRSDGWFIDGYSTIRPTEDRARVLEYAMVSWGDWMFEDAPGLQKKLDYYCRCIRDAFDTTGWPQTTLWEQYLP